MRAVTVVPGQAGSLAVSELPEPTPQTGELLVEGIAVGVCATDRELADGLYGWAPPGRERLIIGHESLGRVLQAPAGSGFTPGQLVVGVVRMPDPQPCGACAHGEWDMCRNGDYTEHGIKQLDGFAAERWRIHAGHAVQLAPGLESVGVLLEPATVVAKAWEQVERIGSRGWFDPRTALVCGAGPVGLLAAMIGVQRGLAVHVLDRKGAGPKAELVRDLGATFHTEGIDDVLAAVGPDVVIEATGNPGIVRSAVAVPTPYAITVLTGLSDPGENAPVDLGAMNRTAVLGNTVVVGSVNANLRHYRAAADALAAAELPWLQRLITRRVGLDDFADAFLVRPDDVKVALTLS